MDICTQCPLHLTAKNQVVGRGSTPAQVLLIGEAPGETEDIQGRPFCGPSGRLLNEGIMSAAGIAKFLPAYFITNVIRCRPRDEFGKNRDPSLEEVWACQPNLEQVYIDVEPQEVVLLGKVAAVYAGKLFPGGTRLDHPAYILRNGGTECPQYLRFVRNLSEVFRRIKK